MNNLSCELIDQGTGISVPVWRECSYEHPKDFCYDFLGSGHAGGLNTQRSTGAICWRSSASSLIDWNQSSGKQFSLMVFIQKALHACRIF